MPTQHNSIRGLRQPIDSGRCLPGGFGCSRSELSQLCLGTVLSGVAAPIGCACAAKRWPQAWGFALPHSCEAKSTARRFHPGEASARPPSRRTCGFAVLTYSQLAELGPRACERSANPRSCVSQAVYGFASLGSPIRRAGTLLKAVHGLLAPPTGAPRIRRLPCKIGLPWQAPKGLQSSPTGCQKGRGQAQANLRPRRIVWRPKGA